MVILQKITHPNCSPRDSKCRAHTEPNMTRVADRVLPAIDQARDSRRADRARRGRSHEITPCKVAGVSRPHAADSFRHGDRIIRPDDRPASVHTNGTIARGRVRRHERIQSRQHAREEAPKAHGRQHDPQRAGQRGKSEIAQLNALFLDRDLWGRRKRSGSGTLFLPIDHPDTLS